MIYVVMQKDRQTGDVKAVASFSSNAAAMKHADTMDTGDEKYGYRVDPVQLNPAASDNGMPAIFWPLVIAIAVAWYISLFIGV